MKEILRRVGTVFIPEKDDKINFASTTKEESEVIVRLDYQEGKVHICSCWPVKSRMLVKRYGLPHEVTMNRKRGITSAFWTLPLKAITFRSAKALASPRKGSQMPILPQKPGKDG